MRTTLNISDDLMREIVELSGIDNKTKVIELALSEYIRTLKRQKIADSFGLLQLDSDISALRESDCHG